MVPNNTVACPQCDDDEDVKPVILNTAVVGSPLNSNSTMNRHDLASDNSFVYSATNYNNYNEGSSRSRPASQSNSPATCDSAPEDYTESVYNYTNKPLRVYGKWSGQEQRLLVQLWCEHNMRTSRVDAPKWKEIAARISVKRKITGTQCQRKMKYLRDLYKEAKAYNEEHGNQLDDRKTSPFYHEIDAVLGCRDSANSSNDEEASASNSSAPVAAEVSSTPPITVPVTVSVPVIVPPRDPRVFDGDRREAVSYSTPSRLAYWSSLEGPAAETEDGGEQGAAHNSPEIENQRKRRKKNHTNQDNVDNSDDKETAVFRKTMERLQTQGDRIAFAMESMQKTQNQQLELMTQFMNTFLEQMRQTPEDE